VSGGQRHLDLCAVAEIPDPGTRGFEIGQGPQPRLRLFVVRNGGLMAAYRNSCPHTGAPLEWQPDQFMDIDNSFIQCSIHGALFRPEDGFCVRGPCAGGSLERLDLVVVQGRLRVLAPSD
jgi:nitrite reductase/ring-hydroxylating ferredoxin subunit